MKITIDVHTLDTCKEDCPNFELSEAGRIYAGDRVLTRSYECANWEICLKLREELRQQKEG